MDALDAELLPLGLSLRDDLELEVARGLFRARDGVSLARLPELTRSWEAFDRAMERVALEASEALLERTLWPALSATALGDRPASELARRALILSDRHVALWTALDWERERERWRRRSP